MKAKVITEHYKAPLLKEGEIVELVSGMETDSEGIWNIPNGKLVLCKKEDGRFSYFPIICLEIVEDGKTDWDAYRREVAKDILAGFASAIGHPMDDYAEQSCKYAIHLADVLIKQLKEDN